MPPQEHDHRISSRRPRPGSGEPLASEPLHPTSLPSSLAEFLRDQEYACVTEATELGTILVVKAPSVDIESARGAVPIGLRHELYEHPAAPVIRLVTTIYDQPQHPLALETFINVSDEAQRVDYAALATQDHLYLFFYDEQLQHRLSKQVRLPDPTAMSEVLTRASALLTAIPTEQFNFEEAKAAVQARTRL
jgi:hypothetical protein